jgi:GrpB-like predicted nucleotidyltransferase (UPF0157 family)
MNEDSWPVWATEQVIIENYNPKWPVIAAELVAELKSLYNFGDAIFEHIGSTAVPNLPAKPIVDLMASIDNFNDIDAISAALETMNWHLIPPGLDKKDYRRTFVKVIANKRYAHFHLVLTPSNELKRHRLFRDLLRQQPALALDYAQLKKELAHQYANDREQYTDAKSEFITSVLEQYLL